MNYLLQRLAQFIPVLVIVSFIIFGMARLAPVDPAIVMAGGRQTSPEVLEAIRERYHLKDPIWRQYLFWAGDALRGDLGESFRIKQDVRTLIISRLPISLQLVGLAFLVSTLIALPLGILSAAKEGTWIDAVSSLIALIGVSTPVFFTGIVGVLVFSYTLGWLPAFGTGTIRHLILPATALGLNLVALTSRTMRSSLLEALQTDYVRTAKAKGLSGLGVILKHGVRNAMLPVVTVLGLQLGFLLVGTVLVEYTFGLGGFGSLIVDGVQNSDYPIVQGTTMFVVVIFMALNLLTDLVYAALDPRIRYG
jgi:peptide/nickel transport system permease protein